MPDQKKILIADDDKFLQTVLKNMFNVANWHVSTADDGEATLYHLQSKPCDLLLLDLVMPKKDGFEVLHEIKHNMSLDELSILVLSNQSSDENIRKAMSLGASDFYIKSEQPVAEIWKKASILT